MSLVLYERKGHITYITMNRPEKLNSLNAPLFEDLREAWVRFRDDEDAWVAIITGAGKAFSVGLDLAEVGESRMEKTGPSNLPYGSPLCQGVWKPTIAAINGWAIAAGWYIALECDIRVATENAQMALREVEWGMASPGVDSLSRHVSLGLGLEILFTAKPLGAQRAYEMGLVNSVVPVDQLMDKATALAESICENAPLAIRATKQMVYKSLWSSMHEVHDVHRSLMASALNSEDYQEGCRAFAEKRKPQYKGK